MRRHNSSALIMTQNRQHPTNSISGNLLSVFVDQCLQVDTLIILQTNEINSIIYRPVLFRGRQQNKLIATGRVSLVTILPYFVPNTTQFIHNPKYQRIEKCLLPRKVRSVFLMIKEVDLNVVNNFYYHFNTKLCKITFAHFKKRTKTESETYLLHLSVCLFPLTLSI